MSANAIDKQKFVGTRETSTGKRLKIIVYPMKQTEARTIFPYRPVSKYSESRFGGNGLYDDTALLLNGRATRCKMCHAPTKNVYLIDDICPDCDGRSESNGTDPHQDCTMMI